MPTEDQVKRLLDHHLTVSGQIRSLTDKLSALAATMSRTVATARGSMADGLPIDLGMVESWAQRTEVLELGSTGPDVTVLEHLLRSVGGLYSGSIDEEYGKLCRRGVMEFQQHRLLPETGVVDPATRTTLAACFGTWSVGEVFPHPIYHVPVYGPWRQNLGYLPDTLLGKAESGKISTFGGPYDPGDRMYGQAYINGDSSPRKLLQRHPQLVQMGVLRTEEQLLATTEKEGKGLRVLPSLDEWPVVGGKKMGTSWALNPDSFYCAMRFKKRGGMMDASNPKLLVWADNGKAVVVLRTDWGPAASTGRIIDLSPGAVRALGLRTDSIVYVCWADDDLPLGLLG